MSDINKYSILDIDGAADVANNLLDSKRPIRGCIEISGCCM